MQIRRVRYPVRKATQALTARRVPGGPLLVHKLVEARYRHHAALLRPRAGTRGSRRREGARGSIRSGTWTGRRIRRPLRWS